MIRGLHAFFDYLHAAVRVDGRLVQNLQKQILTDVIRSRTRDQHTAGIQELQRTQVDLFITTHR